MHQIYYECNHDVLINRLFKLAQEKSVVMWTDRPEMTLAVDWDVNQQTNQNNRKVK